MKLLFTFSFFFLLGLLASNCRVRPSHRVLDLSPVHQAHYLDSLAATRAITVDESEGFFEQVTAIDMAIQMAQPLAELPNRREELLEAYRTFLRQDVEGFSEADRKLLDDALQQAFQLTEALQPGLFPLELRLIKTKGRHYGPSVYYTRDDCIIIPENELATGDGGALLQVMLHELFHIYSRYHPEQRQSLYRLIGFEPLAAPLDLPDSLHQRLLLNPDGINTNFGIVLDFPPDSQQVQAIPLITSNQPDYSPERPGFFAYLHFQLYPFVLQEDRYRVLTEAGYRSPLPAPGQIASFFRQIGDNTNYIIHPDEILADNFVLLVLAHAGTLGFSIDRYSERGQEILRGMERLLQEP